MLKKLPYYTIRNISNRAMKRERPDSSQAVHTSQYAYDQTEKGTSSSVREPADDGPTPTRKMRNQIYLRLIRTSA